MRTRRQKNILGQVPSSTPLVAGRSPSPVSSLDVRGPYKGPSGYEHHVREFVREMHHQGVAVRLTDLPEWGPAKLPPESRDPWFSSLTAPVNARTVLHFCMPHQVETSREHLNVNYTMFEATRIPPAWVEASRNHDLVILPTESSRRAWIDSGVPEERLRLCPLGINPAIFSGHQEAMHLQSERGNAVSDYRVRFLNVSELGPRKNLLGLLQAWLCATSWQDDAVLIIKLGSYAPGWLPLFQQQLASLQAHLGKRFEEAAPVHFIHDLFSDSEMPALFAAATHYISMSFGEGWDQAMVEAGASGLHLIAPDHSAYRTYLDESVAKLIPAREADAFFPGPTGALFQGAQWWEPDQDAACAAIRAAIEGQDGDHGTARDRILSEFTWELATSRLLALMGELEADKLSRRWWRSFRPATRGV